jgi:hypothetical protein
MSSEIDLETGQVARAIPRAGGFFYSFLMTLHPVGSVNGSRGRGGRSRDARNGYPWASHESYRKFTAVGDYWPRY